MNIRHANPELMELVRAGALTNGGTTYFGSTFPLGEGWIRLHMRFTLALTVGNGSGALSEGELQIIKGITLRTDRGELICNNVPGRWLYRNSQIKLGTAGVKTAIAASSASYYVPIDIYFSDPKRLVSEEAHMTILDTKRYGSVQLTITMGTVSDLLGTPGTATLVSTVDIYAERFRGILPKENTPELYTTYGVMPPQIPSNQTFIDLERSENLSYKRLMVMSTTGSTAGVPLSGTADDTVISDIDVELTEKYAVQNVLSNVLQRQAQIDYELEAIPAGLHFASFVDKSRTLLTMLKSSGQSKLRVNWRNQNSLPSTPQVTVAYEGIRPLVGR